jgi:hypothetical protein
LFAAGFWRFCNSQAIIGFDSGGAKVLVPKPAGRVSASLRRAGLRLARLKPVFISASRGRPEHLFSPPPRVAASCLFQSAAELGTIQNAKCTIHNYGKHIPQALSDTEDLAPGAGSR